MPTASLRLALFATAFALPGVLLAQAPAPAAPPAPSASAPPKGPSGPAVSKSATPAASTTGTPGAAPAGSAPTGAASTGAATGTAPSGTGKRNRSSSNTQGASAGATGTAGGAPTKSTGKKYAPPTLGGGMGRAFADLQTTAELDAYRDKVRAVKSVSECKTLMEDTKKQLEPRAKAQNKTISVDIDKACATAKERRGLSD